MDKKIRVLVVDDSALMCKRVSDILNSAEGIEVVGIAKDGKEALKMFSELKPDVITLDVEMPEMDGLACLGFIMKERLTPVVMLSAYTQTGGQTTMRALECGAVDFVSKPSGVISLDIDKVAEELVSKVKMAYCVDMSKIKIKLPEKEMLKGGIPSNNLNKIVIIGASTGGPKALLEILPKFPADISACILVVQHMPVNFTKSMAEHLNSESHIGVKEARDGDRIYPGIAYVVPGDFNMTVERVEGQGEVIRLTKDHPEISVRPSIDVTMSSVAQIYGKKNIGVILTGMGKDGTEGLVALKNAGGKSLAEDQATCIIYGMPKSAAEAGVVDKVVPLNLMAQEIIKLVNS